MKRVDKRLVNRVKWGRVIPVLIAFFVLIVAIVMLVTACGKNKTTNTSKTSSQSSSQKSSSKQVSDLPAGVARSDWSLVLVNRDHTKEEMSPDVTEVSGILVDSRIADATAQFLAAAQAIDPNEHLISGYRSVETQAALYQGYIEAEEAADPGLTPEAAEQLVQTYSQPPGASEHQTGLAIDMSTVDSLNESDTDVAAAVQKIAPDYGFVLRFPQGGVGTTGVEYEDWHYRYVGVENAKYMTAHNLTLEAYLDLLP